jgi:hypothetical protein
MAQKHQCEWGYMKKICKGVSGKCMFYVWGEMLFEREKMKTGICCRHFFGIAPKVFGVCRQ